MTAAGEQRVDGTDGQRRLAQLIEEHADLGQAIDAMRAAGTGDQLTLARMKKRKLRLKDEISLLQDQLVPDIIA